MVHTSNTLIFSYPFFGGGVVGEKTGQKYARIKDACHNTSKSLKESKGAHKTPLPGLWLTSSPPSSLLHLRCHFFMGPQQLPVFPLDYAPYLIMQASALRSHQPQNHATNNQPETRLTPCLHCLGCATIPSPGGVEERALYHASIPGPCLSHPYYPLHTS